MSIKSDNHALKALAEEVGEVGMYTVRDQGPRVQDGCSFFHGIWADARFTSKPLRLPVKDD